MRCAVLHGAGDIRFEERDIPEIGEGELLVRTRACGICSGDIVGWYVQRKGPRVFGHEPAGVVEAVGAGAPFEVGERVFVHHHAPCFSCAFCRRGDFVQCETWRASAIDPGGMAEFFRVPAVNVRDTLRLPDGVSFEDAALVEPLACVVKSLRRGGLRAGDRVLAIGLGVMGLLHVLLATHLGARVTGTDFNESRCELARRCGASTVAPGSIAGDFDVVICGPGTAEALAVAIAAARPGGCVVMFTPLDPRAQFVLDAERFYFRDLRLVASYSSGPNDTREALALVVGGIVRAERIGATTFPLERVADAYRALAQAEIVKPIVTFSAPSATR